MRISKEKAENIAIEVCKPIEAKIKIAKEELQKAVLSIVESHVPKEIQAAFKKHHRYIETRSYIYPDGIGFSSRKQIMLGKSVPLVDSTFKFNAADSKTVNKLLDAVSDLEKLYAESKLRFQNTILGLGTYAKVKEQLPELEKFLPPITSVALVLPIKEVRKQIKELSA